MFKFDKRIWFLFAGVVAILLLAGYLTRNLEDSIYRSGLKGILFIALIIPLFSSRKMLIGLKPNSRVSNFKYIVPFLIILLIYALMRSQYFNYETWSTGYIGLVLLMCYLQTLGEEFIFRGVLINEYLSSGHDITRAAWYSSILFGALHLIALFGDKDLISVINQSIVGIFLGMFLAGIFLVSRNIYMTGLAHMLINIPSYFKLPESDITELAESSPIAEIPWVDTLLGTIILLVIYSPFLISGIWLISKARHTYQNLPVAK
ncbi:MAG: CPBP family intramembrane metalloprotease [Flavobacteriaceae bacterium]|nr:CPBP family intramembrane metalloprotease [Flavobacteriaceae bacterium]